MSRTVTTHPAETHGRWFYRITEEDGEAYDSPAIFTSAGSARRAGVNDAEMCEQLDG